MGTIRVGEFAFEIHGREHNPPHCHVRKGGFEAIIAFGPGGGGPYLWAQTRMPNRDVSEAKLLVADHVSELKAEWNRLNPSLRS